MSISRSCCAGPARRGKSPAMSLVFSDCAYVVFDRPKDAERFAVHAMRPFILNNMPVRMGLSYSSFTNYEFKTGVLPNGHLMFAAPFMGTAVVDPLFSYLAPSEGAEERVVSLNFASWNRIHSWLRQLESIRSAA